MASRCLLVRLVNLTQESMVTGFRSRRNSSVLVSFSLPPSRYQRVILPSPTMR